jgi:tripartite-type tricarboxylate transporter receptor subunit TctC
VLNVPGSAGIIGVDRAVRANNGHAILLSADAAIGVRISMAPRPPHDPRRDLAPITLIGRTTNILVVGNNQPIQNLADLVALARTRPGTVTFGHAGHGTSQHVGGEMLAQMAGVELTGIACNETASQINDVMTGRVTMSFQSGVVAPPRLRGNAWRAIAVLAPARLAALPNVPTVAEPEMRFRLGDLGVDIVGSSPDEFGTMIEREAPRMAGALSRAGIRPE